MMEAPPDSELSSRTWLVSHGACVQLAVLFLLSLGRSDPYVVAPLVVLYAVRERDRKAMLLYLLLTAGGVFVDVLAILFGATAHTGVVLGQLLAKAAMLYPAIQCHDALPQRLPAHLAPSQLQASLAGVVHQVLRDELGRMASNRRRRAGARAAPGRRRRRGGLGPGVDMYVSG